MITDRRMRLWTLVVGLAHGRTTTIEHVGAGVIAVTGVDGVAVSLVLTATPRETVYVSGPIAERLEDLTMTVGEGPSADTMADGPSLVTDLTTAQCTARWPGFAPAAVQAGVRALFALPMQIGGIRLGVMDLCRAEPGPLSDEALADALVLTDMASSLLLDSAQHSPHSAFGSGPLRPSGRPPPEAPLLQHPVVHQATGMITVQLGVTAAVALSRLRARAYATERRLRDVAADVVDRQLRFEPGGDAD